jgi:hypothetical protein
MHQDPRRKIEDEALSLDCEIAGQHPVQAEGRIRGYPFYFRAKWDQWQFRISLQMTYDPAALFPPDSTNGFFYEGEIRGFFLSDDFPEASYMRYDQAEAIIRNCVRRFEDALEMG